MNPRTYLNFALDLLSLVVMLALAATGGLIHIVLPAGSGSTHTLLGLGRHDIGQIHFYLALASILLLALHVALHWSWVCCVIAKLLGRESPSRGAQTAWGIGTTLAMMLLLAGGLGWASTALKDTRTGSARGSEVHGTHVQECPAAEAISGRASLEQAAIACRMSVPELVRALGLPSDTDSQEQLGRLKRRHGLEIDEVRRLVCQE